MTTQDFELLCSLNVFKSNSLGWTEDQSNKIRKACAEVAVNNSKISAKN